MEEDATRRAAHIYLFCFLAVKPITNNPFIGSLRSTGLVFTKPRFTWASFTSTNVEVGARRSLCISFSVGVRRTPCTCRGHQRALVLFSNNLWPHGVLALIHCPLTKPADYRPLSFSLCLRPPIAKKLLFLEGYKSYNCCCFEMRCRWERGSAIRVNSVKCFSPSLSLSPPLCGVTRITCFSPNGHFCWQVHYTPYFQIVFPLLMPGRLIARGWLAEKGPRCVRAPNWKTLITVFLRAWLRPLKGKILTFSPLSLLSTGTVRRDGPCHQNDSINSSERTPYSLSLSLSLSSNPTFPDRAVDTFLM